MALGVAAGVVATNLVIRPLEAKLLEKWPMLAKYIGIGEILIGGYVALKSKHEIVKGAGIGVLATGVHNTIKHFEIFKQIPGIHGPDDYQTIRIPLNNDMRSQVAGLIDNKRDIYTNQVAGMDYTKQVAGSRYRPIERTMQVAGDWDEVYEMARPKM